MDPLNWTYDPAHPMLGARPNARERGHRGSSIARTVRIPASPAREATARSERRSVRNASVGTDIHPLNYEATHLPGRQAVAIPLTLMFRPVASGDFVLEESVD